MPTPVNIPATNDPTNYPTPSPTFNPTDTPIILTTTTSRATNSPTTDVSTSEPTATTTSTTNPTAIPTTNPTYNPTGYHTDDPSSIPTVNPTIYVPISSTTETTFHLTTYSTIASTMDTTLESTQYPTPLPSNPPTPATVLIIDQKPRTSTILSVPASTTSTNRNNNTKSDSQNFIANNTRSDFTLFIIIGMIAGTVCVICIGILILYQCNKHRNKQSAKNRIAEISQVDSNSMPTMNSNNTFNTYTNQSTWNTVSRSREGTGYQTQPQFPHQEQPQSLSNDLLTISPATTNAGTMNINPESMIEMIVKNNNQKWHDMMHEDKDRDKGSYDTDDDMDVLDMGIVTAMGNNDDLNEVHNINKEDEGSHDSDDEVLGDVNKVHITAGGPYLNTQSHQDQHMTPSGGIDVMEEYGVMTAENDMEIIDDGIEVGIDIHTKKSTMISEGLGRNQDTEEFIDVDNIENILEIDLNESDHDDDVILNGIDTLQ